jgi:hypothetical protein
MNKIKYATLMRKIDNDTARVHAWERDGDHAIICVWDRHGNATNHDVEVTDIPDSVKRVVAPGVVVVTR